eukprot:803726-Amphidinium_carterae.1
MLHQRCWEGGHQFPAANVWKARHSEKPMPDKASFGEMSHSHIKGDTLCIMHCRWKGEINEMLSYGLLFCMCFDVYVGNSEPQHSEPQLRKCGEVVRGVMSVNVLNVSTFHASLLAGRPHTY